MSCYALQDADIGLGPFVQTEDRMRVVDYAFPLVSSDYLIIMKRPPSADYMYFMYPFSLYTWLAIITSLAGKYKVYRTIISINQINMHAILE